MAVLNFCGWETGDFSEIQSGTGTFSISTTTVRTGLYSLRCNPTGTAIGNNRFAAISTAGVATTSFNVPSLYSRGYFRIALAPASADEEFYVVLDTSGTAKASFRINSSRQIVVYNNADTLVSTGATALALDTWYRIEILTSTGAGSQPYEVRIDGAVELSGTMNMLTNNHGSVRCGKAINHNGQSIDFFYDDWLWSDSGFPGEGQCVRLSPNANGTVQQFTAGTNASNHLEVDEAVTDGDTTYVASNGTANQTALFGCDPMPPASVINSVKAWARGRSVSGTSATRVRLSSGGVNDDTVDANWTTSYVNRFNLSNVDPFTGAPWLHGAVSAAEVGVVESNAIVNRLTTTAIFADYVPGSAVVPNSNFLALL